MEREYSRNQRSYRTERGDSRNDYRGGQGAGRERPVYGEKRERREVNGNRNEYRTERGNDRNQTERGRRNEGPYRERKPGRYTENREYKPRYGTSEDQHPRRIIKRGERNAESERRPRIFKRDTHTEAASSYRSREDKPEFKDRNFKRPGEFKRERKPISREVRDELRQKHYSKKKILSHRLKNVDEDSELRLNRYISMGGVCSRRDADELIVSGRVKVNGEVIQTVGMKVRRKDKVEVDGVQIFPEKKVYLVLNKPKDYVTTVEDPLERKTVMVLVENACKERIYPVGRLDRQTTGVLLFTNDGDLAKKLTHPKYDHKKIYHVFLDRPLSEGDFQAIATGVELEDGFIKPDEMEYTSPDCMEVGIEIHSGKNRIVRRIFEHFGYQIIKLDRVYFAGITKKNLPRGKWRFLTSREVNMLKVY